MRGPRWLIDEARSARRDPLDLMFPPQRAFALAMLPAGARVVNHAGRRSGKSNGVAYTSKKVMDLRPYSRVGYFGMTKTNAEDIIWPALSRINSELGLGWRENRAKLTFTASNGSAVHVLGAKDRRHVEMARGVPWDLAVVDECGSFSSSLLGYLVDDVLEPTLADYNGRLVLLGTPGVVPKGYYHDACQPDSEWDVHHWTMLDNPHLLDPATFLRDLLARRGWTRDHPTYVREYMGQWVLDTEALVYDYDRARNAIATMPEGYAPDSPEWKHLLSIDYGFRDSTAWTMWAFRRRGTDDTAAYIPWSVKWHSGLPAWMVEGLDIDPGEGLIPSDSAKVTKRMVQRHKPISVWGDSGGLGKGYIEEANRRWGLSVRAAEKLDMIGNVELLNDGLRTGRVRVAEDGAGQLIEELETIQWRYRDVETVVGGVQRYDQLKEVDPRFDDHCSDSARYGYPEVRSYANRAPAVPVEAADSWIERERQRAQRQARRKRHYWE